MIKAPEVWNGVFNAIQARGEGVVVGIIDTGIRHDHDSFAGTSPSDGYVHINPLGNNVYLGDCVGQPNLCNSKLIGSYNFVSGNTNPADEESHGTHVASTAAGNTLDFDLGGGNSFQLSGVAPRANIISYKIADSSGSSEGSASIAAIEQAIADGVDVINYSFGSDAIGTPWSDSTALAYLSAREAGIFVATSAGNSGPQPETVGAPANAPWLTSVAATTHDRGVFPTKSIGSMSGGDTTPPADVTGRSLTGSITANIVYAGNYSNGDTNPEQCLNPFPAGTFTGEIVVCDRGEIARVKKAENVAVGGAGGFVLANVDSGATNLADDIYVIPGIHIAAAGGNSLRTWLSSGAGHTATVTGTSGNVGVDPDAADIVAGFSSRGPNPAPASVLTPSLAAPGVNILAADLDPVLFGFKSGTSMASPHVAGAAALVIQLQPNWGPAEVHSALSTTGSVNLTKEDGVTAADSFDIGGGRVDIPAALNAGLHIVDTGANFRNAAPGSSVNPKDLNLPSMANSLCLLECSWTRNFTAAEAGTWNVTVDNPANATISVSQNNFSLTAGQSVSLDFNISISGLAHNEWVQGAVTLQPDGASLSTTRLPVVARNVNSTLAGHIQLSNSTSSGSHQFADIQSIAQSNVTATGYLAQATELTLQLAEDSDNSDVYDDVSDGATHRTVTVPQGAQFFIAQTDNSSADDIDLYVGLDTNGDGIPQESEEISSSRSSNADEEVVFDLPAAGTYWILVQNFTGSSTSTDNVDLTYAVVGNTASSNLTVSAPMNLDGTSNFNIDLSWADLNPVNTEWFGVVALGIASDPDYMGSHSFQISRGGTPDSTGGGGNSNPPSSSSGGGSLSVLFVIGLLGIRRRFFK
ncbi:MAG: S8 family serine peptidase [Kangiellaceae bacterium]|nr:S8 family serine peptidase [Kangiellaceae bacterium]